MGYLPMFSKSNEADVWKVISEITDLYLKKYSTTLEQDIEILADDDKKPELGFNKRNCVQIRRGEKEVLHFLKECSMKFAELILMTDKEAKQEINSW